MIAVEEIRRSQALIGADEHGSYLAGNIADIQTGIHVLAVQSQIEQRLRDIYRNLSQITFDIWNIGTLLARIEWTRQYAIEHYDFLDLWRSFVSVDIGQFHVEFRSIFDYAASILRLVAKSPDSVPQKSYRKLYEWLTKAEETERSKRIEQFGQRASNLVTSTSWFMNFRNVRDSMVHRGSYILVFGGPEDGTLFQIFDPDHISTRVQDEIFLVNQTVADFELYSAFWLTHLLLFLEDFTDTVSQSVGLELPRRSRLYSGGLDIARLWMDKLANKLSGPQ